MKRTIITTPPPLSLPPTHPPQFFAFLLLNLVETSQRSGSQVPPPTSTLTTFHPPTWAFSFSPTSGVSPPLPLPSHPLPTTFLPPFTFLADFFLFLPVWTGVYTQQFRVKIQTKIKFLRTQFYVSQKYGQTADTHTEDLRILVYKCFLVQATDG